MPYRKVFHAPRSILPIVAKSMVIRPDGKAILKDAGNAKSDV